MNIYEASKKFWKIRRKAWGQNIYFDFEDVTNINQGFTLAKESIIADDWEEYKEPKKYLTTKEAMQALLEGRKLRSDCFDDSDKYINLDDNGYPIYKNGRDAVPCFSKYSQFYIYEGK